jgi:hypothetical protein
MKKQQGSMYRSMEDECAGPDHCHKDVLAEEARLAEAVVAWVRDWAVGIENLFWFA